jgi:hypothetical protein
MSEEESNEQAACQECQACYTCQVGDSHVSEVRKFQATSVEYLDPKDCADIEEFIKYRTINPIPKVKVTPDEVVFETEKSKFVQWLKYIFFFRWLKVRFK